MALIKAFRSRNIDGVPYNEIYEEVSLVSGVGRCDFCGGFFSKEPDGIYVCNSCGKTACSFCQGEVSQEYDLATEETVNLMLCKECFKKEVTPSGPSASGLD